MGRALICQKSAILMQGSACPPHLGGGELGREATQESRNSSGGPVIDSFYEGALCPRTIASLTPPDHD